MCNLHWCYTFCTCVTLFALVLHLNCTALSQSESSNFFMCIISSGHKLQHSLKDSFFHPLFYCNTCSFDAHFHRNFVENDHLPVMSICKIIFQEAEMCYGKAILYRPIYPDAYFNLGNLVRIVSFQYVS